MTKKDMVQKIADTCNLSLSVAADVVSNYEAALVSAVKGGEEYRIGGLGTLKPYTRAARQGRNPQTGENMTIPEKKTVKLSVSSTFGK